MDLLWFKLGALIFTGFAGLFTVLSVVFPIYEKIILVCCLCAAVCAVVSFVKSYPNYEQSRVKET